MTLPPLPRPPRWLAWSAGAMWLGLVILGAAVGGTDSFAGRLATIVVGTAAPIAFAIAGGGAVLEAWQRREWRHHTQFVAFDAFEQALNALARTASELYAVLAIAFTEVDRDTRLPIAEAFRLPFGEAQAAAWRDAMVPVATLAADLFSDHRRAREQLTRHRQAHSDARWTAADAAHRAASETLAELRQDPELAELLPDRREELSEPAAQLDRASPPTELTGEEAAGAATVPAEIVRDLLDGARNRMDSIVSAVNEMQPAPSKPRPSRISAPCRS